jgi:radical SAM protein with 4Fe4S-binding SPASM domain
MSCNREYWGVEFSPEEIREARLANRLLSMELELSRACNLRCIYCYAASGSPLPGELSIDEIEDAVRQAAELGARKIIVLGGGEPLLYPDLFRVIGFVRELGMEADLFTNGVLMTDDIARRLYEAGVSISIKMNSRNPDVQDLLAARPGTFRAIERGFQALVDAGYPDEGHTLGIETVICRQNYDELPDLWRWARRRNVVPYFEIMTAQGRALEHDELYVSQDEIRRLFETLSAIDEKEFDYRWVSHPPLAASQCARHEYSCTVTSTGDVHPCPGVSLAVGNIREMPLKKILATSPVIAELRNIRKLIRGKCSSCELGDRCYGCRGHAYQVTGDYLAPDPVCWFSHDED